MAPNLSIYTVMMTDGTLIITEIVPTKKYLNILGDMANTMIFNTPAHILYRRTDSGPIGFMLDPWVPNELLSDAHIVVSHEKIQAVLIASPALEKFYTAWAKIEREKMQDFSKDFETQIEIIEKHYLHRWKAARDAQKKDTQVPTTLSTNLSEELIALFEDNTDWGDPSVTH